MQDIFIATLAGVVAGWFASVLIACYGTALHCAGICGALYGVVVFANVSWSVAEPLFVESLLATVGAIVAIGVYGFPSGASCGWSFIPRSTVHEGHQSGYAANCPVNVLAAATANSSNWDSADFEADMAGPGARFASGRSPVLPARDRCPARGGVGAPSRLCATIGASLFFSCINRVTWHPCYMSVVNLFCLTAGSGVELVKTSSGPQKRKPNRAAAPAFHRH